MPASERSKIHLFLTFIHEVIVLNVVPKLQEPDARFFLNQLYHLGSDCGVLLGSLPATKWYKVCPESTIHLGVIASQVMSEKWEPCYSVWICLYIRREDYQK